MQGRVERSVFNLKHLVGAPLDGVGDSLTMGGTKHECLEDQHVQGTLDMLILQTLVLGAAHGQTIAHAIERGSDEVLQVEHGSLYPALHRLQNRGWIAAFWGTSENNRKARYYRLTPEGKRQLAAQTSRWEQVVRAIGRILNPVTEKQG